VVWIVDCSFASALFLPDEKSEHVAGFFKGLDEKDILFVPSLWWYELSNVLSVSVTRRRLVHSNVVTIISLLRGLPFETDSISGPEYVRELFELSGMYGISSYDAAYLELSLRKNGALATIDDELSGASVNAGIPIYRF
jgi:predicted nucleic acid-binding protein